MGERFLSEFSVSYKLYHAGRLFLLSAVNILVHFIFLCVHEISTLQLEGTGKDFGILNLVRGIT